MSCCIQAGKSSVKNAYGPVLALAAFLALTVFGASAILVLLTAGVLGLVAMAVRSIKTRDKKGR